MFRETPPDAFMTMDLGAARTVVGISVLYAVTNRKRAYITAYKLSHSLGPKNSDDFTYWINPDTGALIFTGISSADQDSALSLFEPQSVRTVKIEPQSFVTAMAFRLILMFCSGKFSEK